MRSSPSQTIMSSADTTRQAGIPFDVPDEPVPPCCSVAFSQEQQREKIIVMIIKFLRDITRKTKEPQEAQYRNIRAFRHHAGRTYHQPLCHCP